MEQEPQKTGKKSGILQDPKTGRFVEGNVGGGRPKGTISITSAIKRRLEEEVKGMKDKKQVDLVVDKILEKAIRDGDTATLKVLWNYVDGMPNQSTDITSNGKTIFLPSEILEKNGITPSTEDNS